MPTFDADLCVLALSHLADCQLCVAACPTAALIDGEDALGFDDELCIGCGLCRAVCPQQAISLADSPPPPVVEGRALLACGEGALAALPGSQACVHSLGLGQLAQLYRRGARHLEVATADCESCKLGAGPRLATSLAALNRLLVSRGLAGLDLATEAPGAAGWQRKLARPGDEGPDSARRRFLGALLTTAKPVAAAPETASLALAAVLRTPGEVAVAQRGVPRIDPQACSGCDACFKLCPTGALISRSDAEDGACYEIAPDLCSACGLCVAVCEASAIEVEAAAGGSASRLALHSFTCSACGSPSHRPATRAGEDELCRICTQARHHSKLFQVLD